jgi:SCY1-like protein 2
MDEVLPMLQEIPSREPAVLLSILGIYKVTLTHKKLGITKELLATKIIPFLFPLCIDNSLNLVQFNAFMSIVKDMISRVEAEHRTKLEQLNTVQQEQKTLQQFAQEATSMSSNGEKPTDDLSMMDSFMSGIGFGRFTSLSTNSSAPAGVKRSPADGSTATNVLDREPSAMTSLPPKTTAASLTLEDKARLAQEQELQQRMKSQEPLQAQAPASLGTKTSVRDLSSTLLATSIKPPTQTGPTGSSTASFMGHSATASTVDHSFGAQSGVRWSNGSSSSYSTTGSTIVTGGVSWSSQPQPSTTKSVTVTGNSSKSVDMSAFDSILPLAAKTRPTLGEMSSAPLKAPGTNPFGAPPSVMPQLAAPGNMRPAGFAAGNVGGMTAGNPGSYSMPAGFGFASPNVLGGSGGVGSSPMMGGTASYGQVGVMATSALRPLQPTGFIGGLQPQQNTAAAMPPLSNKDIADLLG